MCFYVPFSSMVFDCNEILWARNWIRCIFQLGILFFFLLVGCKYEAVRQTWRCYHFLMELVSIKCYWLLRSSLLELMEALDDPHTATKPVDCIEVYKSFV